MKRRARGATAAACALALVAACATPAINETAGLEGRWRNTGGTFHFSDGTTMGPIASCRIEYSGGRSVSECTSQRGTDRLVSTYRLVAPGVLESRVIENKNFPEVIGTRSRIEFRIERGTLFTTAYPQLNPPPGVKAPVRVDASWVRE